MALAQEEHDLFRHIRLYDAPGGEEVALIPVRVLEQIEDIDELLDEIAAIRAQETAARLAAGSERLVPAEIVHREEGVHPVRAWREYRGLTQAELARRIGVPKAYVSHIETGRRHPGPALLLKLARALDAPIEFLIEED